MEIIEQEKNKTKFFTAIKQKLSLALSKDSSFWLGLFCCALICLVFSASLSNKTMPVAEGWYSYYAKLINEKGMMPYRDFELLFPPLYTYIIALITRIFGYKIIVLRIVGVIVFTATSVFAYLIFHKVFKNSLIAFLSGLAATAFLQTEVVQIFYDYIRFMDLSVFASVYFLLNYIENCISDKPKKFDINIVFASIFATHASLYKQSSGLIFLIFAACLVLFMFVFCASKKRHAINTAVFIGIIIVQYALMFILMQAYGVLDDYLSLTISGAVNSKGGGSLLTILFAGILNTILSVRYLYSLIVLAGLLTIAILPLKRLAKGKKLADYIVISIIAGAVLLFLTLAFCVGVFAKFGSSVAKIWPAIFAKAAFFWISTAIFIGGVIIALKNRRYLFAKAQVNNAIDKAEDNNPQIDSDKKFIWSELTGLGEQETMRFLIKLLSLSGIGVVLAYAVTTSGFMSESQVALCVGLVFGTIMYFTKRWHKEIISLLLAAVIALSSFFYFNNKIHSTYNWWNQIEGAYSQQNTFTNVPMLEGIKMNPDRAKMYDDIYKLVNEHTTPQDKIFVFPHMPYMYVILDRYTATNGALYWFDVSTDKTAVDDIKILKENPPKLMIICEIPEFVITQHEFAFRNGEEKSGLHEMQIFLRDFVAEENYIKLAQHVISADYLVSVYLLP